MKTATLRDLWIDELKDLYNAENQILKALPKMAKSAASPELQEAFNDHLRQTEGHVSRLEQIFESIGTAARGKKCKGMEGIIGEGKEMMQEGLPDDLADAAMISAAQRVEHYEIAAYGTVRTYAQLLGQDEAVNLLEQTLQEEKETDRRLTEIAETVNVEAEREGEGDVDEENAEDEEELDVTIGAGDGQRRGSRARTGARR